MSSPQPAKTCCRRVADYSNPIIPGFAPDPSVVLVNGTFFLVTSSFHIFPGIPIYASKDLQQWIQIGNAINRVEQIDLTKVATKAVELHNGGTMIGAGGLFAPTIRHHQGTFYIVCTNVGEEGDDFEAENFYISTTDIWAGAWSDPKPLDFRGIDPSLFIDDDGRAYIQGSFRLDRTEQPYSTIMQYEIDLQTGAKLSEARELWPGFAQCYTEGPHIYKKDGYYYLLVAEGGTFEHHLLSIARSKSLWGPYESAPHNPVLTADGKPDEDVQDAGHGELFQDDDGLWWATILGVRKVDGRYPLGRESFLTPVDWPTGEWPQLHHPQLHFQREVSSTRSTWQCMKQRERIDDCYIRTPSLDNYKWHGTRLDLQASSSDLGAAVGTASFVGKRQREIDCVAEVTVPILDQMIGRGLIAGLTVYKDDFRNIAIAVDMANSCIVLTQRKLISGMTPENITIARHDCKLQAGQSIGLFIRATQERYEFGYRDASNVSLGAVDTADMTCRDFTGTIFGVFANGRLMSSSESAWISFENFRVTV